MSISWENAVNETQEFSTDPIINKKVKTAVSGLQKTTQKYFIRDIINEKDKESVADFIIYCMRQENIKLNTKRTYVISLAYLCRYFNKKKKSLDEITANELYDYVDSFQPKEEEREDSDQSKRSH